MVQLRVATSQHLELRELSHNINNRLNTISLAMSLLENNTSSDVRHIATAMKSELRDLENLITELKLRQR
jgi:signal transduction histidine kinase